MVTKLEQMMAEREARGEARGFARGLARGEARGEARGLAPGEACGEARGRAEMLLRLLRRRFGPVPADVDARVRAASIAELNEWFDVGVNAPNLDTVFKGARTDEA